MPSPFPGMDPYLEHSVLWEGFHARMIPAMANALQPALDPRYIATVEERVFIEGPQRRVPDIWVQKVEEAVGNTAVAEPMVDTGIVVEIDDLEIHQKRVEILDLYSNMKLVGIIELVSPTNKRAGPGRVSYLDKQKEILSRDCHLVEIDLHRTGEHVVSIPEWRAAEFKPYDYLSCVSRWPLRRRFTLYPTPLRQRLPRLNIPLSAPDADVTLDLQAVLEQVDADGRYAKRIQYDQPCQPPLSAADQQWATERIISFRADGNGAT
ncbi:MAG: DUF4058 family protein [Planctomycetes bacterium]|nr:DUF4058 family protein [Planctomycetota bacterium]